MENLVIPKELEIYRGKKVFITGATGFKGAWLALMLHHIGARVYNISLSPEYKNSMFEILKLENIIEHGVIDIQNADKLKKVISEIEPDFIFHLAAQALVRPSYDKPVETFNTNIMGSIHVLEAIRNVHSVRSLIYVTSDKCYKNKEWQFGYREIDELGGYDPYSASKAAAEIVFESYKKSFFDSRDKLGVASVRAGNVIGGGDWAQDRIIPDCIRSLMNNKEIPIRNPSATRPWQHVLEPLFGYMSLAAKLFDDPKKYSGSFNFGPESSSNKTVKELAQEVIKNWGNGEIKYSENASKLHEAAILQLCCDKAKAVLHWNPCWDFQRTIFETISWYKAFVGNGDMMQVTLKQINTFLKEKI